MNYSAVGRFIDMEVVC